MVKLKCCSLLNNFTLATMGFLSCVLEFFLTVMYGRNKGECYVEPRIQMYKRQKVNSISGIVQYTLQMIDYPPLNETWGWKEEEVEIVRIWYKCSQFLPNNDQPDTDSSDMMKEQKSMMKEKTVKNQVQMVVTMN